MRGLFFAPLKPPDHPVPSGDRAIARNMMTALNAVGAQVELASRLRCRLADPADLPALRAAASHEVARVLAAEGSTTRKAAFVFTYHLYYKAPDLVGADVARSLGVPYLVAEASRAPKRRHGAYGEANALADAALDSAAVVFAATRRDRVMLEKLAPRGQRVIDLPAFVDLADWPAVPERPIARTAPPRLLCVAMMRPGYKFDSYRFLAEALTRLLDIAWTLDIVGDGPVASEVRELFARFGPRVRFHGRIDRRDDLVVLYSGADLFVWPGVREPFGLVYLEAQACGVPCLATADGGVPDAVAAGVTGVLVPPGDTDGYARALRTLLVDVDARFHLRANARSFVAAERSLTSTTAILQRAFASIGLKPRLEPRA